MKTKTDTRTMDWVEREQVKKNLGLSAHIDTVQGNEPLVTALNRLVDVTLADLLTD